MIYRMFDTSKLRIGVSLQWTCWM